jgi:hypothetical protein
MKTPLSKYISCHAIEGVIPDNKSSLEARDMTISFILIQIKDDDLSGLEHSVTSVCDIILRREFMVDSVISSLIVATVGFPMKEIENPLQNCKQLAEELVRNHRGKLKVLYGSLAGKFGTFGHPQN